MNNDKLNPIKFFKEMIGKVSATDLLMKLFGKLMKTLMGPIFQELNQFAETVNNAKNNIEKKMKAIKQIAKMIKKILKLIIKAIIKVVKVLVKVVVWLVSTPPGWCVLAVLLIVLLICYLSTIAEALGGFRGTVIVDVDRMKELNIDSSDYTDLLNTDALLEAFYQDVSDKSFYQMFNVRNMSEDNLDGVSGILLKQYANLVGGWNTLFGDDPDFKSNRNKALADIYANKKEINGVKVYNDKYVTGFSGILNFPQYDPRYIYTDANKNPLKYLKKAEIVGTNEATNELSAYFRDYYKREKTFMLSEELLYELNKYMYMDSTGANSIVYPEAFTQPLHFVNDYLRLNDNKNSKSFGENYVYVTQRITLDDIRDQTSKFYGKYQLEGIIKSTPSKYVYDYAISKSNVHAVHSSDSAMQVNIGNVTDYVTVNYNIFYDEDNDEDKDEVKEVVELYWKAKDDKMDIHMGVMINEDNVCDYFEGPYLKKTVSGDKISLSKNMNICNKDNNKKAEDNKSNWKIGVVNINTSDNEITYDLKNYDEDFDTLEKSTDTKKYIDPKLNLYPRKHVQVAPIEDEDGNLFASSRNLFNKVYIQVKTIKNPYRSSDEYWSQFSDFIESDLDKGAGLSECTGDAFEEDHKLDWSARKCSLIRHYMSDSVVDWIRSKGSELVAWFKTGDGTEAELEINEKAMYGILLDYEDYLMSVGTYNVEWEYKYFSQTEDDKLASLAEHSTSVLKWLTPSTTDVIKGILGDDSDLYKDTFQSVTEGANKRTVASEYVPVAIITGNDVTEKGAYSGKNTWGWGYKYDGDNYKVKPVYGEASMQFPEYYTYEEEAFNTVTGTIWKNIEIGLKKYTNFYDSPIGKVLESAVKFFDDTTYGQVTYGMPNFKYFWKGDTLQEAKWYGYDEDGSDSVWGNYKTVKDEKGDYIDFRNDEYAWNQSVDVWRPVASGDKKSATMTKCTGLQCGRVVTKADPDDYLPMEVKGVRDYGLGSILSYIESRKVVFNTGVAMADEYNINGVDEFAKKVNELLGTDVFKGQNPGDAIGDAAKGYIPKEFLDLSLDGWEIDVNGKKQSNFTNIYKKMPQTLETLQQMAMMFNAKQGTGEKSVEYNGCTYTLGGLTADGTRYEIKGAGSNCMDSGLSAFVPHVKESWLASAWNWLWNGDKAQDSNQFWDPMYYYLSWFDYFEEEKSDNIWSKAIKFISGENFYSHMDTKISQELRNIKNKEGGKYDLKNVSKVSNFLTKVFNGAGDVTEQDMDEFFKKYGGKVNGLDLIDRLRSEEVYLIEEAATLIGEFMYTYEDVMTVIGNLTEEDVIVDDLAFIDRYYYLSNYVFALPYINHGLQVDGPYYDDSPCEDCDWKSATDKCNDKYDQLVEDYEGVVWYKPWTWFNKQSKVYDFGSHKCLKGTTSDGDSVVKSIIKYKDISEKNVIIIDTPEEIIKLIEKLDDTSAGKKVANKIMINAKFYADLAGWAGIFKDNESDLKDGINYADDKPFSKSTDYKKTYGTSSLDQFTTNKHIYDGISFRKGLVVNRKSQIDPDQILLTDNGNIDDTKYEVGLKDGINSDLVADMSKDEYKLTNDDLKAIKKAIMSIYGLKDDVKVNKDKITVGKKKIVPYKVLGANVGYKKGKEWADAEDMLLSIYYADRAKQGYPIPLYLHVAGDTKQIMPEEINKFFDGEVLDSWKKRVTLNDEDSMYRDEYIRNYHKSKETYLYDYLENFEAYIPLDVKSDEDMQVRGKDSFLSIGSNETTPIEKLSQSTNAIMQSVLGNEWSSLYNRLGIQEESMAQLIAGLMEYTIEKAPERMIMEYNEYRENNSLSPIKDSAQNKNAIEKAIEGTMYIANTGGTNYNELRKVKLKLEDDTEETFLLAYVGIGGIKDVKYSGNGGKGSLASNKLTTENFGGGKVKDDKTLIVNNTTDERMFEQLTIDYVSVKFRKLLQKHGSTAGAIMAYFYSEDYWNQLKVVAQEDGLSTGPEWYVAEDGMIEKAVCLAKPDMCGKEINVDYYTSEVVDDVLSYVANTEDRLSLIRFSSSGGSFGGSAAASGMTGTFPPNGEPTLQELMAMEVNQGLLSTSSTGYSTPGKTKAYMGWQCIGDTVGGDAGCGRGTYIRPNGTNQGLFANAAYLGTTDKNAVGSHKINKQNWGKAGDMRLFDDQGFGIVNERYTIAVKPGYGGYFLKDDEGNPRNFQIGDYIDVYLEDGTIIPCIMADAKAGENPSNLLHQDGSVIEFVVNKWDWYNRNPRTAPVTEHPEWNQNIVGLALAGTYWGDENITVGYSGGGGNIWANTIGFNAYTRDELSLQNSGIEVWSPYTAFKREDIDMIMLSQASRDGEFVNELNSYDLLTLFTTRQDEEGALGGSWDYGSSSIQTLGTGTDREVAVHELTGMPPLFRTNRPFAEGVPMRLTSPFGYRNHPVYGGKKMHQGIDLGTGATNPDIFAIAPGKVILNKFNAGGYGWYVIIEHDLNCISSSFRSGGDYIVSNGTKKYKILGVQSLYAHQLVQSPLPVGTLITPENINQKIGTVGSTGASTGNHLHFEIKVKAQEITESGVLGKTTDYLRVDPQVWLTTSWYADESGFVEDDEDEGEGEGEEVVPPPSGDTPDPASGVHLGHEIIRAY